MSVTINLRNGPIVDGAPRRIPYDIAEESDLNSLTFGTGAPTAAGNADDDTYFVTDDGTSTGDVEEVWKWDEETSVWVKIPSGVTCPAPMTRAALLGLRNAGELNTACHYVITDYNRGTVGAATVLLHAVDEKTLSMDVHVKTTFDNLAWDGRYDIDANRIVHLVDNVGNVITGEGTVDAFPWNTPNVYENVMFETVLNYTGGQMYDNNIQNSTITFDGTYFCRNTIDNLSTVSVTGGSGVSFYDNEVQSRANVRIIAGTNVENEFGNSTIYRGVGTGTINRSTLANDANITNGNVTIDRTQFTNLTVNTTGSTGVITYTEFNRSATALTNIPDLDIIESRFDATAQITATSAARLRLYRSNVSSARVLVSGNATLVADYVSLDSYSYMQVTAGALTARYCDGSSYGYFRNLGGSNLLDRCSVSSGGTIRFDGSGNNNRMYYTSADSGASVYMTAATGCYFYYIKADSAGQFYCNNRTNARMYYCDVSSYSYIRSYGSGTGQTYMYYCSARARGYVDHINIGALIRFYAVSAEGQSIVRQTGGTANANLYYSTFHAYYYALLALTGGTRTGLHGTGRQSFNGMPASNGTGARNFT